MHQKPTHRLFRKFRVILFSISFAAVALPSSTTQAEDFVFRRSYYSHVANDGLDALAPSPNNRSAYRFPITSSGPGFAIRGGYRINRMAIQSGNSYDVTIFRQNWFEVTP